jgi:cytochrome c oxidase subunit 3
MPGQMSEKQYAIHPSAVMMVLILSGVTTLFGALSIAYIYSRADMGMFSISVPWLFIINTFILAFTGVCIQYCYKHFKLRNELLTIRWGFLTVGTTLLFLIMQGIAWNHLLTTQITPGSSGGYGYLYAISILHFLHVAAGIPFLLRILIPMTTSYRQGNASLLFIDDHIKRKLRHTTWYWHFIDVVWIYLMVFFLVSSMI